MASYRIISQLLWQDPEFRALPPMAGYMLVQIRLMATNIIALYKPDWELIGELTRLDRAGRKAMLAELGKAKLSGHPWLLHEDGYAWVLNGFRHEFGFRDDGTPRRPSPQQIVAATRALSTVPTHISLRPKFAKFYSDKTFPELHTALIPYLSDTLSDTLSIQQGPGQGPGPGPAPGQGQEHCAAGSEPTTPTVGKAETSGPELEPQKPRPLNAQAQAVKDCLDFYVAGYAQALGHEFTGKPPAGSVVRWLGQQTTRELGVKTFQHAVDVAVEAHKIDPAGKYAYPQRVPLFTSMISDLLGNWVDRARNAARVKREIAEKRGGASGDPKAEALRLKAVSCLRNNPECRGGQAPACGHCARTVKGSKR